MKKFLAAAVLAVASLPSLASSCLVSPRPDESIAVNFRHVVALMVEKDGPTWGVRIYTTLGGIPARFPFNFIKAKDKAEAEALLVAMRRYAERVC